MDQYLEINNTKLKTQALQMKYALILLFLVVGFANTAVAQKTYTDHKPSYRKWQDDYILDKIMKENEANGFKTADLISSIVKHYCF